MTNAIRDLLLNARVIPFSLLNDLEYLTASSFHPSKLEVVLKLLRDRFHIRQKLYG